MARSITVHLLHMREDFWVSTRDYRWDPPATVDARYYRYVQRFDFPADSVAGRVGTIDAALNDVYAISQNIFNSWKADERSSMIGDLMVVDGRAYAVARGCAFKEVTVDGVLAIPTAGGV